MSLESDSFFRTQLMGKKLLKDEIFMQCEQMIIEEFAKEEDKDVFNSGDDVVEISSGSDSEPFQLKPKTIFNPRTTRDFSSNDVWYRCSFCKVKLKQRGMMIKHMMLVHDPATKPLGCHHCVLRFTDKSTRNAHEAQSHVNEKRSIYFCETCGASGNHEKGMRYHKLDDHKESSSITKKIREQTIARPNKNTNLFRCDICRITKYSKEAIASHMSKCHCLEQCKICNATFKRKQSLRRHLATCHQEGIKCTKCDEKFTNRRFHELEIHEKLVRKLDPIEFQINIECCVCSQPFNLTEELLDHLPVHEEDFKNLKCSLNQNPPSDYESFVCHSKYHSQPRTYECMTCHIFLPFDQKLVDHVNSHKTPKNQNKIACEMCGNKFAKKRDLENHIKIKHENQTLFICPVCGKSFMSSSSVDYHIKFVHQKDKSHSFECKICKLKFSHKQKLTRHEAVHKTERPFVCVLPDCTAAFKSLYGLQIHIRRHNGTLDKKFVCPECPFRATTRDRLKQHSLTHSGIVSYLSCCIMKLSTNSQSTFRNHTSVATAKELIHQKEISLNTLEKFTSAMLFTNVRNAPKHFHSSLNFENTCKFTPNKYFKNKTPLNSNKLYVFTSRF